MTRLVLRTSTKTKATLGKPRAAGAKTTRPYIDGLFWIPKEALRGLPHIRKLKSELTASYYDNQSGETRPVELYQESQSHFAVPRVYGRNHFPDLWARADDRTTHIDRRVGDWPQSIKPWNEQQEKFFKDLVAAISLDNVIDLQVCAATGAGKTVATLYSAAKVGAGPLVIIVHTNRIKELWKGNVLEKKGMRYFFTDPWVRKNVGICQQEQCDYLGKKVVIALAPSITSRKYPDAFYNYFGMAAVDEVHKMATPTFNYVMGMFSAQIHVGITATPKQGAMKKTIESHIGPPAIVSTQEVMKPKVYRLLFKPDYPINIQHWQTGEYMDDAKSIINPLVRNKDRQRLLTDIIYWRGFKRARNCLVISDRTDQLLDFRKRLISYGVPAEQIGLYVGAHKTGKKKLTGKLVYMGDNVIKTPRGRVLAKPGMAVHHFRGLAGFDTTQHAQGYAEKTKHAVRKELGCSVNDLWLQVEVKPEWYKPTAEEYDDIEKRCSIVLATYGIFDVAIDISRLDWGLEASPRGDVTQPVGRILRIVKHYEKATPEWYSVYDQIYRVEAQEFLSQTVERKIRYETPLRLEKRRRKSYRKQQATLIKVDDVAEAIEAAQAAARKRPASVGRGPQTPSRPKLRLKRTAA